MLRGPLAALILLASALAPAAGAQRPPARDTIEVGDLLLAMLEPARTGDGVSVVGLVRVGTQDTAAVPTQTLPTTDTATTLPQIVRDSTAVSLPTEPPKDVADLILKFLPLLAAGGQSLLMALLAKVFPRFQILPNTAKHIVQIVLGAGLFMLVRWATGTANTELWTFAMAGLAGVLGLGTTGFAFNAGRAKAFASMSPPPPFQDR